MAWDFCILILISLGESQCQVKADGFSNVVQDSCGRRSFDMRGEVRTLHRKARIEAVRIEALNS